MPGTGNIDARSGSQTNNSDVTDPTRRWTVGPGRPTLGSAGG